jgi:hypothetical protein
MIFWPYDQYPFVLWAPGFMVDDERAWVPSYKAYFNPVAILPMHVGHAIGRELQRLKVLREHLLDSMEKEFLDLLKDAITGNLPHPNPTTPTNFKNHPLRPRRKLQPASDTQ